MRSVSSSAIRLDTQTLAQLPPTIRRPGYDRSRLKAGILHIGVGAFHRCHQAEYTDDALEAAFGDWGIVGVNLKPPSLSSMFDPQHGLYCRELRDNGTVERRIIGALQTNISVLDTGNDPVRQTLAAALQRTAAPDIRVITLTITEKGYCHIPTTGELDLDHPEIVHDIRHPDQPVSAPGFLLRALAMRIEQGHPPPAIISCDNVPGNGNTLRHCVLALAEKIDPRLGDRIRGNVTFANSMVDRIVPATRPDYLDAFEADTGLRDEALVAGEPYRMWVIEADGQTALPPWDLAGALYVPDVEPYEILKMRVVNGIQSNLCQLGLLSGIEFMSGVLADPVFSTFARRTIAREVLPHLPAIGGIDPATYLDQAIERLTNADLKHRTAQISTDGSQKIRQRLLEPIRAAIRAGTPCNGLLLGVAGWMAYATGRNWRGETHDVHDPLAARTTAIGRAAAGDAEAMVAAFLDLEAVFGSDLRTNRQIAERLAALLSRLQQAPARDVVADFMNDN